MLRAGGASDAGVQLANSTYSSSVSSSSRMIRACQ